MRSHAEVADRRVTGEKKNRFTVLDGGIKKIACYLYDEIRGRLGVPLTTEQMDDIIEYTLRVAKFRVLK